MTVAMDIDTTAHQKHEIFTDIREKAASMRETLGLPDLTTSDAKP
jgi:hypothetical protein